MAGFSSLTAAAVAALALFTPASAELVRHEWHESQHLQGWQQRDRLAAHARLPMRIGFAHRPESVEQAHNMLMDTSNPLSTQYGKHLSIEEVTEMFAPSSEAVDEVTAWVVDSGIPADRISVSANKQWLQFEAQAHEAESLLNTLYYHYEHTASGVHLTACPEYHVPEQVHKHIDYITPGVKLASYGFGEHAKAVKRRATRQPRQPRVRHAKRSTVVADTEDTTAGPHADAFIKEIFDDIIDDVAHVFAALAPDATETSNGTGTNTTKATPPWIRGGCERSTTLDCIRKQYGIPLPSSGQTPVPGNEIGIFQTQSQHYSQEDLDIFFSYDSSGIPVGSSPELRGVDGAFGPVPVVSSSTAATTTTATATTTTKGIATPVTTRPLSAGLEADLDLQIAMPLVYPQKAVLFQVDDEWYETEHSGKYPGFLNTFFDAIDGSYCTFSAFGETGNCKPDACRDPVYPNPNNASTAYKGPLMCGTYKPTNVISISYSNEEHALPASYIQRQCLEVLKLGLQGTTVVESSGDVGVGGGRGISGNPFLGCLGANRTVFSPRSLSDCPYVLSVGATVLINSTTSETGFSEIAPESYATGGGFSNVFGTPAWQQKAVDTYIETANLSFASYAGPGYNLSTGSPQPPGLFNRSGRAYPDVSAIGDDVMVVYNGYGNSVAGTSVSTPIWGALLTLINEERLRAGKKPVGFVNPILYQHPEVFTDITVGNNPGCGSTGFTAAEGWDPVTGLGSPKFPKLLELFMGLP
ncbi:alkaline serine protease [Ophiostoma piceae UAMH 11346]|uniref:Alkaline serine protease n=1 Tax=Ophiostoma piceae (strain UAMH 11346) TaxID=1262450 RepID=S3CN76_OPHP1|nr:alkaline serine protease [Ophiostoma piceae UAMH 11346]